MLLQYIAPILALLQKETHLFRECPNVARRSDAGHLESRTGRHRVGYHALRSTELELILLDFTSCAVESIRVRSPQRELAGLRVFDTEVLPVQQRAETLDAIALVDALPPGAVHEAEHTICEMADRILDRLAPPINDVTPFVLRAVN